MFSCLGPLYFLGVYYNAVRSKSTLEARKLEPIGPVLFLSIYYQTQRPRKNQPSRHFMRAVFSLGPCTGLKLQCFLIVLMSFYAVFVQLGKFPVTGCCACTQMNSKRPLEPKCLDVEFWAIRFRFKMPTVQSLGPTSTVQPVRFLIGAHPKEHIEDH
jgi:hypothetical protein